MAPEVSARFFHHTFTGASNFALGGSSVLIRRRCPGKGGRLWWRPGAGVVCQSAAL